MYRVWLSRRADAGADVSDYDGTGGAVGAHPYPCPMQQEAIGRDGAKRPGVYLFTVFWANGGWSEISDQSKDHHIIALDGGQWIAYPNNRLLWVDPSWIGGDVPRDWKSPSTSYSVEAMP